MADSTDLRDQVHIADYVVFLLTIVISLGIGVFFALLARRKNNTDEYLVGGRSMGFLPTAISLIASYESSIMILGLPAEGYLFGLQYVWWIVGIFVSQILSIMVIAPLMHPLKITSANEYLELRFNSRAVRLMGTVLNNLTMIFYMGIVLFGPAVALQAVLGYPIWCSIVVVGLVGVIYTSIGGLKAVIWTDVFQAAIILMGVFAILIQGTITVGGPKQVWDTAASGGRMNFFDFNPDPTVRHTFWTLLVGSIPRGFGLCFSQNTIQRISSNKSVRDAKRMIMFSAPAYLITISLAIYEGAVAYSYFKVKECDPIASGRITNPNQLIPYTVMDMFSRFPGMPGLFVASLFSASLSTLSSGLSGCAAITWADLIKPLVGNISETKATVIVKFIVLVFGGLACAVSFMVAQIGGTLIQITNSLLAAFGGPVTGLFCLGCFFPRSNAKGAMVGAVVAILLCFWLALGQSFSPSMPKPVPLPFASTDQCDAAAANSSDITSSTYGINSTVDFFWENTTQISLTTEDVSHGAPREPKGIDVLYTISYQYFSLIGTVVTVVVGLLVSLCTGMNRPGDVDPRYIVSMSETMLVCLPMSIRRKISSIGPQFMQDKYKRRFVGSNKSEVIMEPEINVALLSRKRKLQNGDPGENL